MGDQPEPTTPAQDEGTPAAPPPQPPPKPPDTAPDKGGSDPAWLPDRLARAERSAVNQLLEKVGAESVEALEAKLKALKTFEEDNQTALEHAQSALEKEQKKRQDAEEKLADALFKQREAAIRQAITAEATKARAKRPEDVLLWAQSDECETDLDTLIDDDLSPVADQVTALITAAKEARSDWFRGDGPGSPSNVDGTAPEPDAKQRQEAARRQHNMVRGAFN